MEDYFDKAKRTQSAVGKAMVYPCVLIVVMVIVLIIMMVKIIPSFMGTFEEMNIELPLPTRMVMAASNWFVEWWWAVAIALVVLVVGGMLFNRTNKGRHFFDWLKRKIPIVKLLTVRSECATFCRTLSLLLGSGLRPQELLALQPKDIAENGSSVSVTKAIKMTDGVPYLGAPKSDRGRRTVPIPERYQADALYLRNNSNGPYVWTSQREGGLFDVGAFRKRYYRYMKNVSGVRPLSPHSFRHTYISSLEQKGVPMEQIARLAGHTRVSTTDGYLHTNTDTLATAVAVLNAR